MYSKHALGFVLDSMLNFAEHTLYDDTAYGIARQIRRVHLSLSTASGVQLYRVVALGTERNKESVFSRCAVSMRWALSLTAC